MIMIIIVSNVYWKSILWGFSKVYSKLNLHAFVKKAVKKTYKDSDTHKGRQVLCNLFITNKGNGSKMEFVAGATKIKLKSLKT